MRITIKCKGCGKELKTSTVYNTVICEDCRTETEIVNYNECKGCKDYFSGAGTVFCLNPTNTDCQMIKRMTNKITGQAGNRRYL